MHDNWPWRYRPGRWWIVAVLLLALFVRLYRLDAQSLWADEGNSAALAGRPFATIARHAALDIHPPLYYFCLRVWTQVFGNSELALRSLSVVCGLVLVGIVFLLGKRLYGQAGGLVAAFFAALSPFQVYYSQEARMYMMAACLAGVAAYAVWRLIEAEHRESGSCHAWFGPALLYVAAVAAGLYTHYFFPVAWLAWNAVYLVQWGERRGWRDGWARLGRWLALQLAALAVYLPWLGIGLSRLRAWPAGDVSMGTLAWLEAAWRTLCLGPAAVRWPAATAWFAALVAVSVWPCRPRGRQQHHGIWAAYSLPVLGWLLPAIFMLAFGVLTESRLKFLLLGSPFLALSMARGLGSIAGMLQQAEHGSRGNSSIRQWLRLGLACVAGIGVLIPTIATLERYYFDAQAGRDDYRGIVTYIAAVARSGDAVILNAPGQQDVFSYYYDGPWPVYRLPEQRPPDRALLEGELARIIAGHRRLYVLYWATNESDPERIMETWLDTHAFKGVEAWYGNVRFVIYETPAAWTAAMERGYPKQTFGDAIVLDEVARPVAPIAAGDLLPISFSWRAIRQPATRLKVFVQVLDAGNHVVGQRDAEPVGGTSITTEWQPGQVIMDHHGILIEPGTPPGIYQLIAGLYELDTGRRLVVQETGEDHVPLGNVIVERPTTPVPLAALRSTHRVERQVGPLKLIGYDRHELGKARHIEEPLARGAILHLTLYWQAVTQPAGDWLYRIRLADRVLLDWAPLGGGYPTSRWMAGEVVRDQTDQFLPADVPAGRYRLRMDVRGPEDTAIRATIALGQITVR